MTLEVEIILGQTKNWMTHLGPGRDEDDESKAGSRNKNKGTEMKQ